MKAKAWLVGLAAVFCVTGCQPAKGPQAELPTLHVSGTPIVTASHGVQVKFSKSVSSVSWQDSSGVHTLSASPPTSSVTLPAVIQQGEPFHVEIRRASGANVKPLNTPVVIQGTAPRPLTVTTNPGIWQFDVPAEGPITLQFSAPVKNEDELQSLLSFSPAIAGTVTWTDPTTAEFVPSQPMPSTSSITMTLKGGPNGIVGTTGQFISSDSVVRPFVVHSDERIVVTESLPETLTLYKNGKPILRSLCNTGVGIDTTPTGQFWIHSMLQVAHMRGINPDGTPYDDPHVPWVMGLFGNVAIHGYEREKYGFPQSNGCVELPLQVAKTLFHEAHVGIPVYIEKPTVDSDDKAPKKAPKSSSH